MRSECDLAYQVEMRDVKTRAVSCTFADFRRNGLGTCKHVEAVLLHSAGFIVEALAALRAAIHPMELAAIAAVRKSLSAEDLWQCAGSVIISLTGESAENFAAAPQALSDKECSLHSLADPE